MRNCYRLRIFSIASRDIVLEDIVPGIMGCRAWRSSKPEASSRHARACACSAADYFPTGIESSKIEPSASDLTSRNLPPWFSATVKQMASPNPMPPDFVAKNGSNIRFRSLRRVTRTSGPPYHHRPVERQGGREARHHRRRGHYLRSRRIGITRALALAVRKRTRGSPRSRDRDFIISPACSRPTRSPVNWRRMNLCAALPSTAA